MALFTLTKKKLLIILTDRFDKKSYFICLLLLFVMPISCSKAMVDFKFEGPYAKGLGGGLCKKGYLALPDDLYFFEVSKLIFILYRRSRGTPLDFTHNQRLKIRMRDNLGGGPL